MAEKTWLYDDVFLIYLFCGFVYSLERYYLIHLFSQFEILVRPTQMDPFSQSLKLPTIHTSFTIKSQLAGLVAFGKNTDQTLMATKEILIAPKVL